jgi:Raf kinase inhibitor-like YbhB/YbcL family protein
MNLTLSSTAFKEGGLIPVRYTCDGEGMSPPLAWTEIPVNTVSLALIVDDPDSPTGTWVHWVVYNIPPSVKKFPENLTRQPHLNDGTKQGVNDSHRNGYFGPCPHSGIHRYNFKLYALDKKLDLKSGAAKTDVEKAMHGHILQECCLMGEYQRKES